MPELKDKPGASKEGISKAIARLAHLMVPLSFSLVDIPPVQAAQPPHGNLNALTAGEITEYKFVYDEIKTLIKALGEKIAEINALKYEIEVRKDGIREKEQLIKKLVDEDPENQGLIDYEKISIEKDLKPLLETAEDVLSKLKAELDDIEKKLHELRTREKQFLRNAPKSIHD